MNLKKINEKTEFDYICEEETKIFKVFNLDRILSFFIRL